MHPLGERVSKIRDFINIDSPRKQHVLRQDDAMWLKHCSCMNVIEDTEEALEYFLTEETDNSEIGKNYLRIYGALQALFVQQDAVINLHTALAIKCPKDETIIEIRDIRNAATGHPTDIKIGGNQNAFGFMSRVTLSSYGFKLMKTYPEKSGVDESRNISVPHLIATQKIILMKILDDVIETLKEEDAEHKMKFTGKTLTSVFQNVDYFFSKLSEATISENSPYILLVEDHVDLILKAIDAFKTGLKEREEPDEKITHRYENLDYTLHHIKRCFGFGSGEETHINRQDAYIFANYAQQEVDGLKEIAQQIDERYATTE